MVFKWMGHSQMETTAIYAQVATRTISAVTSPLDRLTPLAEKKSEASG